MCGMVLGALGAVVSAIGSIYQGKAQAAAYKAEAANHRANAKAKRLEARMIAEEGAYASGQQIDANARLTGDQVTAFAASGLDSSYGSAGDVIADSRREGEMDVAVIRRNASYRSRLTGYGAKIDIFQSKVALMNADSAKTAGYIGAIAPLINGFTGLGSSFG